MYLVKHVNSEARLCTVGSCWSVVSCDTSRNEAKMKWGGSESAGVLQSITRVLEEDLIMLHCEEHVYIGIHKCSYKCECV